MQHEVQDETTFMRTKRATVVTSLSRRQLERLERADEFPRRVQLGERAFGYVAAEVRDWVAQRIAARNAASNPAAGVPTETIESAGAGDHTARAKTRLAKDRRTKRHK